MTPIPGSDREWACRVLLGLPGTGEVVRFTTTGKAAHAEGFVVEFRSEERPSLVVAHRDSLECLGALRWQTRDLRCESIGELARANDDLRGVALRHGPSADPDDQAWEPFVVDVATGYVLQD